MHGAIVKAVKTAAPEAKGLPVVQPAAHSAAAEGLGEQGAEGRERLFVDTRKYAQLPRCSRSTRPAVEQHLEVVADRRLPQAERLGEMADARLAAGLRLDEAQEPESRRIGQHLERSREAAPPGPARAAPARSGGQEGGNRGDRLARPAY